LCGACAPLAAFGVGALQFSERMPPSLLAPRQDDESLALIQTVFTDGMMGTIFSYLGPYALGPAACVCRQWRFLCRVRVLSCSLAG
jgi:hypothetical protein